jgi:hypothetical protein
MKKFSKSLSVKGFPLKANLVFEISFKVDQHQSGIATIRAKMEACEPQEWVALGVPAPTQVTENDLEINTKDTLEKIRKFMVLTEKNATEELAKLAVLASVGQAFAKGVEDVFAAGKFDQA